jgi:hypothetical protein
MVLRKKLLALLAVAATGLASPTIALAPGDGVGGGGSCHGDRIGGFDQGGLGGDQRFRLRWGYGSRPYDYYDDDYNYYDYLYGYRVHTSITAAVMSCSLAHTARSWRSDRFRCVAEELSRIDVNGPILVAVLAVRSKLQRRGRLVRVKRGGSLQIER